ncbi:hypothetical protein W5O_03606, partial [Candida albicans Ca6]
MRFATAQLAALAYYILSTEATFPLLGDIFNCIPHNTPPVCTDLGLYHDSSISLSGSKNKREAEIVNEDGTIEKRTFGSAGVNAGFNAAFVVSNAKKLSDGSYGIDCNFKSDSSVQLNSAFGKKVKQLSITGTGYSDISLLGNVANPFEWSASLKVKAEIVKGKCCLPSGFRIVTDFESNCPEFDAIKQFFGSSQIIYKVNAVSNAIGTFDASALFNAQVKAFPAKRELDEFEELSNDGVTHSKRTLGLLLGLLKKVTGGCDTLQQFCWDCQCDTPSPSTTTVSTSSAPSTSPESSAPSTSPESSAPSTTTVTTSSSPVTSPESSVPETTTVTTSSVPETTPESSAPETTTVTTSSVPSTTPESSAPETTPESSAPESSVPESSAPE